MTNVNAVIPIDPREEDNDPTKDTNPSDEIECNDLHEEKDCAMLKSKERNESLLGVLNGDSLNGQSIEHLFTGLIGILMCVGLASVYTLIPWNDAIRNPQYSYESLMFFCLSFTLVLSAQWVSLFSFATNTQRIKTFQFFFELWMNLILVSNQI